MQDGKALQAGTSHYLGENFARAFDVQFQSPEGKLEYVQATSWGVSTRLIGSLIMAHSDEQGLILPPRLAPVEVVIVPIYRKDHERDAVLAECQALKEALGDSIRTHVDDRTGYKPGYKFNEWELKGVPLRIEVGPRDLEKGQVCLAQRFGGEGKEFLPREQALESIPGRLDSIQKQLYERALEFRKSRTRVIDDLDEFRKFFEEEGGGFALCHWDGSEEVEKKLSDEFRTTIRCIPDESFGLIEDGKCIYSGKPSSRRVVMAQAY